MRNYPEQKIKLKIILRYALTFLCLISGNTLMAQTPPVAMNDTIRMCEGTAETINILDNDIDVDLGEILEVDILAGPTSLLIDYEDGAIEGDYTIVVDPGFIGEDAIIYEVCGEDDLCDIATIVIIVAGEDGCVWPGDANFDSVSNFIDLLPIGVYFGSTGPARYDVDGTWEQSFCDDWTDLIGSPITPNPKFADCNGDGVINANDTLNIVNNYGQLHGLYLPEAFIGGVDDPLLSLDFFSDTIESGSEVVIPLKLGTAATPATNIYGLAFRLDYDETLIVPGSIRVTFNAGWLGTPGTDLLSLSANDTTGGIIDVAVTRINQLAISGNGNIGEISFVMEDNIAGKTTGNFSTILTFCIEQPSTINSIGEPLAVQIACDSVVAYQVTNNVTEINMDQMIIAPNPADDKINIQFLQDFSGTIQIINVVGQIIEEQIITTASNTIITQQIPSGTYIVLLKNEKTVFTQKVIIQH